MRINDYLTPEELKEFQDMLMIAHEINRRQDITNKKITTSDDFKIISIQGEDLGWIASRISELQIIAYERRNEQIARTHRMHTELI